jgi:hypothetical protein
VLDVRDEAVAEDDSRYTGVTGLGFDGGVVAAMGDAVLCRKQGLVMGRCSHGRRKGKRKKEMKKEERKKGKKESER